MKRSALFVVPLLLLTACGTTVPLTTQRQVGDSGALVGGGASSVPAEAGGITGGVGGAVDPAASGQAPVGSSGPRPSTAAPSGSAGGIKPGGGGSTGGSTTSSSASRKPLTIGIATIDYSQLARQFGANLPSTFYSGYENLIKAINLRGGLNGRPVKAVYHTQNGAANDYANEAQQTCADFTQDHKVDVVLTYIMAQPALAACLKSKGILQIDNQQYAMSEGELATYPNYVNTAGITLERTAKAVIGGAARVGTITKDSVLGIMTADCSSNDHVNAVTVPALQKQYGFKVVNERLKCFSGVADLGSDTSQIQSAVVKFRQNGVTDVFGLTGSEGFVDGIFAKAADSQKYYPRYLVSSNLFPWSNNLGGQFPQKALETMRGFGWTPYVDTGDKAPVSAAASAQKACAAMDPGLGETKSGDPNLRWNNVHFFYAECDQLLLLGKMLAASGNDTSMTGLRAAYEQVVGSFPSAAAYDGRLAGGAGRHDAPALMQRFAWTASCACFLTVGGRVPVPG